MGYLNPVLAAGAAIQAFDRLPFPYSWFAKVGLDPGSGGYIRHFELR
jgi:hypothetical protein